MLKNIFTTIAVLLCLSLFAQTKITLQPSSYYQLKSVASPKISPDGQWILYQLSSPDSVKDKIESKLNMMDAEGKETIVLTEQTKGVAQAQWSPNNEYISYLAKGKQEQEGSQLYLLNRKGGEPIQQTHIKAEIESYSWMEDGQSILFQIKDASTTDTAASKIRKPYEINRYQFKNDSEGYLDNRKSHLYLYHFTTKKLDTLTKGNKDETDAVISPNGEWLAYTSNTTEDPDQNTNTDIFLLNLNSKEKKQLTYFKGANERPQFSPNSEYLLYNQSSTEGNFNMYSVFQIGLYQIATGELKLIKNNIDASIENIVWSKNSQSIYGVYDKDRNQPIIELNLFTSKVTEIANQEGVYSSLFQNKEGKMVCLYSNPHTPNEIYIQKEGSFKKISHIQDDFTNKFATVTVKSIEGVASDKNLVKGILYLPNDSVKKLPLILFIHGGPVAQDDYGFDMSRQILASAGFAVAAVNYRGSSGRGLAYTRSIYGDWGNKEVKDIIAIANQLIKEGIVDSTQLGIGGWSYGGILTNYTIATDKRFKAGVSGAGSSLQLSLYGSDQYITQYEEELGKPWKNINKWLQVSYPFFKVDQIVTPTLFMASEDDFNVPVAGAEQMYQAFKSVGIPTELVIYPSQHHGLRVPSYIVHRYQKNIDWFKKYLK